MRKFAIVLIAGIFMGLTTAPFNVWFLAWFSLAPLWFFITKNNCQNSLKLALVWGLGYHGLALFWITGIHPMTWMGVPWIASFLIAIFVWFFISFWGAFLVVIWSCLFKLFPDKSIVIRLLFGVSLWCGLEYLWSLGDLWWTSLSYTQSPFNLYILHLSQFSGPNTVTAIIVLINGLIAESLLNFKAKKPIKLLLISTFLILFISHLIGFLMFSKTSLNLPENEIKIGLIQGNIPNTIKLYPEGWRKAIEGYTIGYQSLARQGVEIILTPETALPFDWDDLVSSGGSFYQAILAEKIPVFVGAFGKENNSYTNSLFTINRKGKTLNRYDKVKLVPLGEYIPFNNILGKFINRLSPLDTHLLAGKLNQNINSPVGKPIVGICYESAFSSHFRRQTRQGGEFIIVASNNAHYSPSMPAQHHAQNVMRAIENNRWLASATNTGYSAIIDNHGVTQWISNINEYQLHSDSIYRKNSETFYVKFGDFLTPFLLVLSGIIRVFRNRISGFKKIKGLLP
jgi:apolipoprotein N-acyltransferase